MDFLSYSPQLQRVLEALGLTLLHSFWQGLILMILLWALLRFIRQEKANLRFGLAMAALFLLMTAFAGTFYYEWESLEPVAVIAQEVVSLDLLLTEYTVSQVEPTLWQQVQREANALFFQLSENAVWMAGLWLLGSLFFSARLGLGLWQVRQLRQQREPFPKHWQQIATNLQQKLGIRRKVSFSCSEQVESPLTLGWLKPVILMPSAMLMAMPADQLESILVHELAHIRRHDYFWNLLQSLAEVVLFYHPAYWYMASVLEQEREMACDAITLKVTGRPQVYAQALLQVASLRTTFSPVALSARGSTRGRSGFAERIKRIVLPDYQKKSVQPLPFLLSFCLIGMLLFAFTLKGPVEEAFDGEQDAFETADLTEMNADALRAPDYVGYRNNIIENDSQEDAPRLDEKLKERLNQQVKPLKKAEAKVQVEAKIISGTVTDAETGKPLPGTNILIKGTTTGTVSNREGTFRLQIPEGGKELVIVHIGYEDEVISLEGKETMNVSLRPLSAEAKQKRIEELEKKRAERISRQLPALSSLDSTLVIVNGKARKGVKSLSELNIQPDEILAINVIGTEEDLAQYIDASDKGRYKKVVRIITKKYGVNNPPTPPKEGKPLFIIDGKHTRNNDVISSIHPDSIASIEVIKGKAAAETYGKDGENGVILINTKQSLNKKEQDKTTNGWAEERIISGTITDAETGKPLPGINILFKGSTTGTVSNPEGKFQIQVPEGGKELRFMFIGYEDKVVSIGDKETINVSLKPLSEEDQQKDSQELEKKGEERISRQLPALSSLDSTLVIVNGKARKEVKSLSELNIQPDEILVINVMGTEADLTQYIDATDKERYKKVVRIVTKKYGANTPPDPPKEGKPLFIIDGEVREDIRSFEELESTVLLKYPHSISASPIGDVVVPSLTEEQLKQYEKVITIKTSRTFDPGDIESRIQGKVVDAESGEPIEGVKITVLRKEKEIVVVTDQKGEYRLVLENPEEKTWLQYEAPGYSRYVMPACADCIIYPSFPSVLVFPLEKYNQQKIDVKTNFVVFPNPGNDKVKVRFNLQEAGSLEFQLLDKEGGFLKSFEQDFSSAGDQEISIPVDELPADIYFLRVKLNGQYETRRVINP